MITRFLKSLTTSFSPFNDKSGKTARHLLAMIPGSARSTMKINVELLPRTRAEEVSTLSLGFKDGKTMDLDLGKLSIGDVVHEVDRHSRRLARQEDLTS